LIALCAPAAPSARLRRPLRACSALRRLNYLYF